MTMFTTAGPLGDVKLLGATKGISCSTTVARTFITRGTNWISLEPNTFSTAVVVKYCFNPYLTILKTTDLLATIANTTDYSENAQDNDTATDVTLSGLDTLANTDALYIGAHEPFSGVAIDVDAANSNASVLTVTYRKSDDTWATTSATDGTDSAGASMGTDGSVTWTMPTDWKKTELKNAVSGTDPRFGRALSSPMFWTRWVFSAALDASTTLNSMLSIRRSTGYAELFLGDVLEEHIYVGKPGGYVSFDALTDAGTALLMARAAGRFNAS